MSHHSRDKRPCPRRGWTATIRLNNQSERKRLPNWEAEDASPERTAKSFDSRGRKLSKAKRDSEPGFQCCRQGRGGKGKRRLLGNSVPATAQLIVGLTAIQGKLDPHPSEGPFAACSGSYSRKDRRLSPDGHRTRSPDLAVAANRRGHLATKGFCPRLDASHHLARHDKTDEAERRHQQL